MIAWRLLRHLLAFQCDLNDNITFGRVNETVTYGAQHRKIWYHLCFFFRSYIRSVCSPFYWVHRANFNEYVTVAHILLDFFFFFDSLKINDDNAIKCNRRVHKVIYAQKNDLLSLKTEGQWITHKGNCIHIIHLLLLSSFCATFTILKNNKRWKNM